jgi:hypothetical protein
VYASFTRILQGRPAQVDSRRGILRLQVNFVFFFGFVHIYSRLAQSVEQDVCNALDSDQDPCLFIALAIVAHSVSSVALRTIIGVIGSSSS